MLEVLAKHGDTAESWEEPLDPASPFLGRTDFIVSFGYRHILSNDVLKLFEKRAINLHISYLPWNRGADPNLWSFLEDTPKGVTIHRVDQGIDTGDILIQRYVSTLPGDTLRTSYERLTQAMLALFAETWTELRLDQMSPHPQLPNSGSLHRSKDKEPYMHFLEQEWDTPVKQLIGKALRRDGEKHA
ncbi:MAG TPA: formyltransferase family protein [Noviherbaspirillum sp.]|nr:formyltransferase family protein [Noviherbaspirillum sp.]